MQLRFDWRAILAALTLVACRPAEEWYWEEVEEPSDPVSTSDGTKKKPSSKPPPPARPADPEQTAGRLTSSVPADGDGAFYPIEVYDQGSDLGVGERATLRFAFDTPMEVSESTVEVSAGSSVFASGTWSADARTLEVVLPGSDEAAPLEPETSYQVRLDRLRTAKNAVVTPDAVRFRTSARDTRVDHACIHTLFGPFATATATALGSALSGAPSVGSVHKQWTVDLPPSAEGQLRVTFSGTGERSYVLFTDRDVALALEGEDGSSVSASVAATAPACPGIRRVHSMTLVRGKTYRMTLGPSASARPEPTVKMIWEAL